MPAFQPIRQSLGVPFMVRNPKHVPPSIGNQFRLERAVELFGDDLPNKAAQPLAALLPKRKLQRENVGKTLAGTAPGIKLTDGEPAATKNRTQLGMCLKKAVHLVKQRHLASNRNPQMGRNVQSIRLNCSFGEPQTGHCSGGWAPS